GRTERHAHDAAARKSYFSERRAAMRKHRLVAVLVGLACLAMLVIGWAATAQTSGTTPIRLAQRSGAGPGGDASGKFAGKVQSAGSPIVGSMVTLYAAGDGQPTQLAQGKSGADGSFTLDVGPEQGKGAAAKVLYLVARGGAPKGAADKGPNDAIALLTVLGSKRPKTVTVNEFTTIASVWTGAQFLEGDVMSGPKL